MSTLFSSPQKSATAAAQASNQISQQDIQQLEDYVSGQQGQLRTAIGAQGPNPYFGAAQQLNPQAYYTDPTNTVNFGVSGPGTVPANPFTTGARTNPPGLPPVILPQQPPQTGTGGTGTGGTGSGGQIGTGGAGGGDGSGGPGDGGLGGGFQRPLPARLPLPWQRQM